MEQQSDKTDTIVAVSTPLGIGAIGIIRLSGSKALSIAQQLFSKPLTAQRYVYFGTIQNPKKMDPIDSACVIFFKNPHSYTGEDMIEIQSHSNIQIIQSIISICIELGARIAQKGEFTKRAFLNNKLTLTQAESVIDLIDAKTTKSASFALNRLNGRLHQTIHQIRSDLIEFAESIEASLDFPEEIETISKEIMLTKIRPSINILSKIIQNQEYGQRVSNGTKCLIVGKPNVGKSSLINQLAGKNRAIVSSIPGTTRDYLTIEIEHNGVIFELIDTAGIHKTTNEIEQLGIEQIEELMTETHAILWMIDGSSALTEDDFQVYEKIKNRPYIYIVMNKNDLPQKSEIALLNLPKSISIFSISALKDIGIGLIKEQLYRDFISKYDNIGDELICNVRQIKVLTVVSQLLITLEEKIIQNIQDDLIAFHLRQIIHHLGEISGETITDEVLNGIFSRFCVGK